MSHTFPFNQYNESSFPGSQRLSEMLRQPFDLYKPGRYDEYIVGLANQVAQAMDDAVTQEVGFHFLRFLEAHSIPFNSDRPFPYHHHHLLAQHKK